MISIDVEPKDKYCALAATLLTANCPDALIGEWIIKSVPVGVNPDDVNFTSIFNPVTNVSVPLQGRYLFAFECCT